MLFWFYYLLIQKIFIGHLLYSPPLPFKTKLASNLMMDALLNKGILDNALMDDHMSSVVQELFLWLRWMVWRTEKLPLKIFYVPSAAASNFTVKWRVCEVEQCADPRVWSFWLTGLAQPFGLHISGLGDPYASAMCATEGKHIFVTFH